MKSLVSDDSSPTSRQRIAPKSAAVGSPDNPMTAFWNFSDITTSSPSDQIEFACECKKGDCERSVKVPLYVYQRMTESGDQYLLQAGHHAFTSYRTIVSVGLMRIEERA